MMIGVIIFDHLHNNVDFCSVFRFAVDLVVCVALGCDMFDCVYPTRTAVSFSGQCSCHHRILTNIVTIQI